MQPAFVQLAFVDHFLFLFSSYIRAGEVENYPKEIAPVADSQNRSEAVAVRLPKIVYWLAVAATSRSIWVRWN